MIPPESAADAVARSAEALVGAPFRLHGRSPETGLDCVGLAALALGGLGVPDFYRLRNARIDHMLRFAEAAGLAPASGPIRRGDVLLVSTGPAQQHLCIATACESFVHAHAGLRRVAIHEGPLPWPVIRHWRTDR